MPGDAPRPLFTFGAMCHCSHWAIRSDECPRVFARVERLSDAEDAARGIVGVVYGVPRESFDVRVVRSGCVKDPSAFPSADPIV